MTTGAFIQNVGKVFIKPKLVTDIPYTWVNKGNSLLGAYWLLSACFFPGFAPG